MRSPQLANKHLNRQQFGVPLAIQLMEQIRAIVDKDDNSMHTFELLQQQILQARAAALILHLTFNFTYARSANL